MDQEDEDDYRELTASERKRLRKILESQERAEWLWSTIRIWALWISGITAGIYAIGEFLSRFVKLKIGS